MPASLTSTELLRYHDNAHCPGSTPDARNGEEFDEAGEHVTLGTESGLVDEDFFLLEQAVDVVKISSGLYRRVSETQKRRPSIGIFFLFEAPARALGTEIGANDKGNSRDESRAELESPRDCSRLADGQVGASSEEYAWSRRELGVLEDRPQALPKAVQTCQDMTRPPRMMAGEFPAEKTGTVTSFKPMPMPSSILRLPSALRAKRARSY